MTVQLRDRYAALTAAEIVAMKGDAQENRHLDFKLLSKPDFGPDDQRHLAKAVSGFANAEGGVVIWGVDARRDPKDDFIDQVVATPGVVDPRPILSKLNGLSSNATSPGLPGLDHRIIEGVDGNPSFVATFVPEGEGGPYMAMLGEARHRYYRRVGSAFSPMDHSMVADMFGRRPRPILQLELLPELSSYMYVRAKLSNVGRGIARAPYLMLKAPNPFIAPTLVHPLPLQVGTPGWWLFAQDMNGVLHPNVTRQWQPLRSEGPEPTPHERTTLQTISYRMGAADIPEVAGRFVMTFEPAEVVFHEPVDASDL